MEVQPVLIRGEWRPADATGTFKAYNPKTRKPIEERYPVSSMKDIEAAVIAASKAAEQLLDVPAEKRAEFLERYAKRIESRRDEIVEMAHMETGLPVEPRLRDVEFPRTVDQLRQAGEASRSRSWTMPTIDTKTNIRSMFGPLGGGVVVFGPNNFPLAFNSIAGGDFAAAIAAGNPVIGKANTSHPGTTRILAEEAFAAAVDTGMPRSIVQLIYRTSHEDGKRLVSHPLIGATGYTGSREAGLVLKEAADRAGKPIYLELSSVNPVIVLPGAIKERGEEVAGEFVGSCLLGTGQFCTNPGIVVVIKSRESEQFIDMVVSRFKDAPVGTLLSEKVEKGLASSITALQRAGAELLTGGKAGSGKGYSFQNTVLRISGETFLENPKALQKEAFGNSTLFVVAYNSEELLEIIQSFEGNLTGSIYSHRGGEDDALYEHAAKILRLKVGRLLNDKMPTGVAVCPAMNHGGPYPATGHPGFTAVGIPASLRRFAMLQCFDNVREHRLPPELRNKNPTGKLWRLIDGKWTLGDVHENLRKKGGNGK